MTIASNTAALKADAMAAVARETLGINRKKRMAEEDEIHRGFGGASIQIVTTIWNLLVPLIDKRDTAPKHLLWAKAFLKVHSTTAVHQRIVGWPDAKTHRKWTWHFFELIASLKDDVSLLDDRFANFDASANVSCLMSVDSIDCMIEELWRFGTGWHSKKFNGPGIKYEVGVRIK